MDDTTPIADAYAQAGGAPDDYWARMTWIESRGDPGAHRPGSQYKGIAQLGDDERQQYGVTDWTDPAQQRQAVNQIYNRNGKFFSNTFGRPPTDAEQYLMHNQGAHGLSQMLSNPDGNAASTVGYSHIAGNWPTTLKGLDPRTISNRDYVNGWTSFYNGAPSNGQMFPGVQATTRNQTPALGAGPRTAMSNDYLAQALAGMNGGGQTQDMGPALNALQKIGGQPAGGGLSPMERAGIYLMSINNPQALSGLASGNRDAEARNANALRAIGLMMQQRNQDRSDQRLQQQLAPKSIYGTPQDPNAPATAPIWGGEGQGTGAPQGAPAAPAAAPSGAPGSNVWGMADEPQATPDAYGAAGGQPGSSWSDWNPDQPTQVAQAQTKAQQARQLPTQADFDLAGSRIREAIANGMKPENALGLVHDPGLRGLVQSWGEGGLNPDSTNRQYDPQTKAARTLASAIYGDRAIEDAWKRTQQENQAYTKEMDPSNQGSIAAKLNAMDNIHSNLFTGDKQQLPLTELYDRLGNKQLDSAAAAYGIRVPQGVPVIGGFGIPGVNTHGGKTQDYVPAFNNRVANYMADVLKLRLQGNTGGTAEERGNSAHMRSADEFMGDIDTGRGTFNKYMQPNEFRNALVSEMGQNIADLQNLRTKAIESVGGVVGKDGSVSGNKNAMDMAARIDRRISQAQHDLDTWTVAHPEQGAVQNAPGNALGAKLRGLLFGSGYAGQ